MWAINTTRCTQSQLVHYVVTMDGITTVYADDSQVYLLFKPTDCVTVSEALRRVEGCLNGIVLWMHRHMLKLNEDKTEVILFSSQKQL